MALPFAMIPFGFVTHNVLHYADSNVSNWMPAELAGMLVHRTPLASLLLSVCVHVCAPVYR